MFRGLIKRQTMSVLIDPYANAFNMNPNEQAGSNQGWPVLRARLVHRG
jgi:meiotically up-regulated gene 157 (Mug157) protein